MSMIGVEGSQVATQASTDELPLLGSAYWWYHSSLYPFHTLSKNKIREDFTSSGLTQTSTADILSHALSIFTHTNPQIRVLEMGTGADTVTRRLLALLRPGKGQQLFSKYTYLSLSPETCQQAKEALADIDGIEFGTLDPVDSGYSLELELGSYDLIISNDTFRLSERIYNAFGLLKDLLRPTGALILLELLQDDESLSSFKCLPNEPVSEGLSESVGFTGGETEFRSSITNNSKLVLIDGS
nr:polyketide synthase [Colletotrichum truncatum]XP_036587359.1 polyketide synthase [Colletotrichum truncatum]KAF6785062.1 polyketide synthase [Colletotrichum truncatum]KAF6798301.1 polyketide synthase [Colletotrichum truncatum]